MVRSYKRKSNRLSWREEDLKSAIEPIEAKEMGWLKASKTFNVPFGTLTQATNFEESESMLDMDMARIWKNAKQAVSFLDLQETEAKLGVLNTSPEILALKEKVIQKDEKKRRNSVRNMRKRIKIRVDKENEDTESIMATHNEDDAACIYCNKLYSHSKRNKW
ncbi:hypothetical protein FQR65_LT04350 [Abscondita terminalis]|nr:hypothetical protein FQR65_LT04350 [Abscondita terminalis]